MLFSQLSLLNKTEECSFLINIRLDFQLKRAIIDIALYNVTADPDERVDLSKKLPDVIKTMQERVEFYKKGTVPELNKPSDPEALEVAKKNGAWTPWRG